jgi:hypothetical protein
MTHRPRRRSSVARPTTPGLETTMQDKKGLEAPDAARMRAWLEGVGGNMFIGDGKLKSVKISKKGNKLTLVVKKGRKKGKVVGQPTAA